MTFLKIILSISLLIGVAVCCDFDKAYKPVDSTCQTFYACDDVGNIIIETCPSGEKWDSSYLTCVPASIVLPGCYSKIEDKPVTPSNSSIKNKPLAFSSSLILFLIYYRFIRQ